MIQLDLWINLLANLMTIFASGIALYLFFFKREKISTAIDFILKYSNQLTLTELKFKIERLNDFSANDLTQKEELINILHEIDGQLQGNQNLKEQLKEQLEKVTTYLSKPKLLTEPKKRSLVSEFKESIRNIDVSNYNDIIKK